MMASISSKVHILLMSVLFMCSGNFLRGETFSSENIPLPEHPRPDFQRRQWLNLNSPWQFRFDKDNVGQKQQWFKSGTEFPYIALNDKPIYLQLTLDQSYHPEGFYTFPSDDFYAGRDITLPAHRPEWAAHSHQGRSAVQTVLGRPARSVDYGRCP